MCVASYGVMPQTYKDCSARCSSLATAPRAVSNNWIPGMVPGSSGTGREVHDFTATTLALGTDDIETEQQVQGHSQQDPVPDEKAVAACRNELQKPAEDDISHCGGDDGCKGSFGQTVGAADAFLGHYLVELVEAAAEDRWDRQ